MHKPAGRVSLPRRRINPTPGDFVIVSAPPSPRLHTSGKHIWYAVTGSYNRNRFKLLRRSVGYDRFLFLF